MIFHYIIDFQMAIIHYYFVAGSHQMVHQKVYLIKTFYIL